MQARARRRRLLPESRAPAPAARPAPPLLAARRRSGERAGKGIRALAALFQKSEFETRVVGKQRGRTTGDRRKESPADRTGASWASVPAVQVPPERWPVGSSWGAEAP